MQISPCDFGLDSSTTPRVIAPATTFSSDLDTEIVGIKPSFLGGLTKTMAIAVDQHTFLYLGYSNNSDSFLVKVKSDRDTRSSFNLFGGQK